jgi:hypothetical protein
VIDFRYHIVSLIAVFLALALGLFLGSTSLQDTVTHNLKHQADTVIGKNNELRKFNKQLSGVNGALSGFTATIQPELIRGRLSGDTVALVSAPGVDSGDRDDLVAALNQAGAVVSADVELQPGFLDATQDAELGQLAKELAHGRPLPQSNGATQAAYEVARALTTKPGGHVVSHGRIDAILNTFAAGKMISVSGRAPTHQANLALLLVPANASTGASPAVLTSQSTILISVAEQLRAAAAGIAMVAPTIDPSLPDGPMAAARADSTLTKAVSTVDAVDVPAGRIATVLALAAAPSGRVGKFGVSGVKGVSPVISPSPTP